MPKEAAVLFTLNGQAVCSVGDDNFSAVERFLTPGGALYVNLGGSRVGSFNSDCAVDSGDIHSCAGRKLDGFANLVAHVGARTLGLDAMRP